MLKQIIECVPNFSEGRNMAVIDQITAEITAVDGVKLLDVDPGAATNRTVVTFAGEPQAVLEAAFRAMKKASEVIDMRKQKGEHPRFGATDVCPLIPIANISMEEVADLARQLGKRVGDELQYPVYLYENAASTPQRRNLADVRSGEYEGLPDKLAKTDWKPDFGPATFVPKVGATAISARDFLVAVNFNLNTTSTRRANAIAFDVREAGRVTKVTNVDGTITSTRQPGTLKACKGIGWFIEEYGIAQVSMNLTNISITSLHTAFEAVNESATRRGMRVTGTEIVGLVPLSVLTEAGKHFLRKQQRSTGVSELELIKIAIKSMGLDDLKPFDPSKKVIEYLLAESGSSPLAALSLSDFSSLTASESPAPGGGSVAAALGSLGAALGTMVANLSSHKRGWDARWEEFSDWAEKGEALRSQLMNMVDEDTHAFNGIMNAFSLPKGTDEEKQARTQAIHDATMHAIQVPFKVMELSHAALPLLQYMVKEGNPNSLSDAAVGALCVRAAVYGAWLNVKINAATLEDPSAASDILTQGQQLLDETLRMEEELLKETVGRL